ncbi:MAG: divalent cation tolerance protein CutA [Candidatus Omnitrophica bacterium]|nr:divalent cation tolerance protein CutA [Candidatus Omnitrophota bacterium]
MKTNFIMLFVMCGSIKEAGVIADSLLNKRLIACANIIDGVSSKFRWWRQRGLSWLDKEQYGIKSGGCSKVVLRSVRNAESRVLPPSKVKPHMVCVGGIPPNTFKRSPAK